MRLTLFTVCVLWLAALAILVPWGTRAAASDPQKSIAAFKQMAKVLNHPRCMNCHTTVNWPTQGDDQHKHTFNVLRGADDKGAMGMRCTTCHQDKNQTAGNVPGAKNWHMAPLSMGWTGLSEAALCRALTDPAKNGKRSGPDVISHLRADALVLWAWFPGGTRTVPPLPHAAFLAAAETWVKTGAHCPTP